MPDLTKAASGKTISLLTSRPRRGCRPASICRPSGAGSLVIAALAVPPPTNFRCPSGTANAS